MVTKPKQGVTPRMATRPYIRGAGCLMANKISSVFKASPDIRKMITMHTVSTTP